MWMRADENVNRGDIEYLDQPAEVTANQLIAEIVERAHRVSLEHGGNDRNAFAEWVQAEQEIRKKYRL
jgi:hypothetical protein